MAGLQQKIPVTFTDATLPVILPSLGASVTPSVRYAGRKLSTLAAGQLVTSWGDALGGPNLTPNAKDTNPDAVPPNLRIDGTSGERYLSMAPKSTVTFTASTDLVTTSTVHGKSIGDQIQFSDVSTVVGVLAKTTYYVKTVPSSTTLTLSATADLATTLDITVDGTGNYAQGIGMALADLVAANHKTIGIVYRRVSGSGVVLNLNNAVLNHASTVSISLGGQTGTNPVVTPTGAFTSWHLAIVRLNGLSSDLTVDGVTNAGTNVGTSGATTATCYDLEITGSTVATGPLDVLELFSYASVLSNGDVAAIRTAMQAAYPGLSLP